jgi:formylmethanofuran dehydrogenase subunit E
MSQVTCDECGVPVSTTGYLGGGIVCKTCAKAKRRGNWDVIERRREKYGG